MKIQTLIIRVLLLPALWPVQSLAEPFSNPRLFRAEYVAEFEGLPIKAKGVRELQRLKDGEYRLTSSATSLLARVIETSEFSYTGDQLTPSRYEYSRGGLGKNKQAFLAFNYDSETLQHEDGASKLTAGTLDKLSYQYQLKLDLAKLDLAKLALSERLSSQLEYTVADGDKLKFYRFMITGEEVLTTPAGDMLTVKLERIRDHDSDRQTTFWLAKDHDYLLAKFKQEKNGKGFELNLKSFTFSE
ncbi:MAG: DUF3108 domain-containing protein [Candidatus Azotimanducaceae bacterium WSBS_2022_MAG_OTU7]